MLSDRLLITVSLLKYVWRVVFYQSDAVIFITWGAQREHSLPRDHSRPLTLTHTWQRPPVAINTRSRDRALGRCSLPARRRHKQEADEAQLGSCTGQDPSQCAIAPGERWPCRPHRQWPHHSGENWSEWHQLSALQNKRAGRSVRSMAQSQRPYASCCGSLRASSKHLQVSGSDCLFQISSLGWIPEKGCRAEMFKAWMENFSPFLPLPPPMHCSSPVWTPRGILK